jgi:hypothetical protein
VLLEHKRAYRSAAGRPPRRLAAWGSANNCNHRNRADQVARDLDVRMLEMVRVDVISIETVVSKVSKSPLSEGIPLSEGMPVKSAKTKRPREKNPMPADSIPTKLGPVDRNRPKVLSAIGISGVVAMRDTALGGCIR